MATAVTAAAAATADQPAGQPAGGARASRKHHARTDLISTAPTKR